MHKQKKELIAKIVIIGDIGVGKSSVTIRYVYDKFDLKQQSTLGAAYMQKTCTFTQQEQPKSKPPKDNQQNPHDHKNYTHNLKLQIWDTAGQQKYRAIAKLYYRDCRVAVLVYDVTRRQSFQNLKRWYQQLFKSAPKGILLFVVANKIDLLETQNNETVSIQQAQTYAKQIQAKFIQVSAKNRTGIDQLFKMIANAIGPIILHEKKERGKQTNLSESFTQSIHGQKKKKCCSE